MSTENNKILARRYFEAYRSGNIGIIRIESGRIVEEWVEYDTLSILRQIDPTK